MALRKLEILIPDDITELTPAQISQMLEIRKDVEAYFKTLAAYAESKIEAGETLPGWELGPGRNSRVWKSEDAAKTALARAGINDPYEHVLLSVAKAEKKVGDPSVLEDAWETKPGKPTLKPRSGAGALAGATKPINYGF